MSKPFELHGPLTEVNSYPQWTQDMIGECDRVKQTLVDHELWEAMQGSASDADCSTNFLVGTWPVIERFPAYMAQSLLKTRYGRSEGDNLARRWLVRNIRVEQNHAEYWLHWADGAGIPRERILNGSLPAGTQVLANWCDEISNQGSLAASIAAVNYAVEGATGELSRILYESEDYVGKFSPELRKHGLRWLQLHAAYDDKHPWEALEIVCKIMGESPTKAQIAHLTECVTRSYTCIRILADRCLEPNRALETQSTDQAAVA